MAQRRQFIQQVSLLAGAFSVNSLFNQAYASSIANASQSIQHLTPQQVATDEDYWSVIQQGYTVHPSIII